MVKPTFLQLTGALLFISCLTSIGGFLGYALGGPVNPIQAILLTSGIGIYGSLGAIVFYNTFYLRLQSQRYILATSLSVNFLYFVSFLTFTGSVICYALDGPVGTIEATMWTGAIGMWGSLGAMGIYNICYSRPQLQQSIAVELESIVHCPPQEANEPLISHDIASQASQLNFLEKEPTEKTIRPGTPT